MLIKALSLKFRLLLAAASAILVVVIVAVISVIFVVYGITASRASAKGCSPANPGVIAPSEERDEQLKNAKIIDQTAANLGLSGKASYFAIIAAIGESSLINLDYGDNAVNPDGSIADSLGIFQQQPSQGWGTREQVMDPEHATKSFLIGPRHDRTGGLVAVSGWESMEPTIAIHEVQDNLDSQHYARYYAQADEIVKAAGIDVNRAGNDAPATLGVPAAAGSVAGCGGGGFVAPVGQAAYPLNTPYNQTDDFGLRNTNITNASTWHPGVDLQNWPACGEPVYAMLPGTVTLSDRLWLSIKSPEGFTISYLHMYKSERLVDVGATVQAGQQIGLVGNEQPSGGCHVDVRINVDNNTVPEVAALPRGDASEGAGSYVNPVEFFRLYQLEICPPEWCRDLSDYPL